MCLALTNSDRSTPSERGDRVRRQLKVRGLASLLYGHLLSLARIRDDEYLLPTWVFERDLINSCQLTPGFDPPRTTPDVAREVSKGPVLSAARDFSGL